LGNKKLKQLSEAHPDVACLVFSVLSISISG
jgi:hypothetical protein